MDRLVAGHRRRQSQALRPPRVSRPPVTPGSDALLFNMNWDDQWVYALGVEYAINLTHSNPSRLQLRQVAGAPTPTFPAFSRHRRVTTSPSATD